MQVNILNLGWTVLPHPPYSDFASNDFQCFCSLQNALNDKKKCSQEDQVKTFEENSSSKPAKFYLRGIDNLSDRWQEVIQNNGGYTIEWN